MKPQELIDYNRKLANRKEKLVAIIDGALWPEALDEMRDLEIDHHCLFTGDYDVNIQCKFPHIFEVDSNDFSKSYLSRMSAKFGILIKLPSEYPLAKSRRALKKFLTAELPSGEKVIFRFYDPRVLKQFSQHFTPEQKKDLFSEVSAYYYAENERVRRYTAEKDEPSAVKI